jgi:hypothetical protein
MLDLVGRLLLAVVEITVGGERLSIPVVAT